jgi:hypothetical protein
MEESDDHEGNPSVGNTANREEQLSVESGSNSSWFRWGGGSAAASLIIWLFLHLPEYIKAADGWASLPEKTPKISGLLKSEKSREQPPVQDKPVIPQAPPPTTGSIDPAKDVPCADWGQARDTLMPHRNLSALSEMSSAANSRAVVCARPAGHLSQPIHSAINQMPIG